MKVNLNEREIKNLFKKDLYKIALNVERSVRASASREKMNRLRIYTTANDRINGYTVNVDSPKRGVPYALYQETGTGLYGPKRRVIKPKRAKRLVFQPKGSSTIVFAKQVKGVYKSKGWFSNTIRREGQKYGRAEIRKTYY